MPSMKELAAKLAAEHGLPAEAVERLALEVLKDVMSECNAWDDTEDLKKIYAADITELRTH